MIFRDLLLFVLNAFAFFSNAFTFFILMSHVSWQYDRYIVDVGTSVATHNITICCNYGVNMYCHMHEFVTTMDIIYNIICMGTSWSFMNQNHLNDHCIMLTYDIYSYDVFVALHRHSHPHVTYFFTMDCVKTWNLENDSIYHLCSFLGIIPLNIPTTNKYKEHPYSILVLRTYYMYTLNMTQKRDTLVHILNNNHSHI